jgi:HEAT repeat protein
MPGSMTLRLKSMTPFALILALIAVRASAQNTDPVALAKDLKSPDSGVRYQATLDLKRCSTGCRAALPALIDMFQKSGDQGERTGALYAINEMISSEGDLESMRVRVENQENARLRGEKVKSEAELSAAGRVAKQADCGLILPAVSLTLAQRSAGKDANLPPMAIVTLLGTCGGKAEVASLLPLLKDESSAVRQRVVFSLIEIGPAAQEALPALRGLLKDPEPVVQQAAAVAIKKIGGK